MSLSSSLRGRIFLHGYKTFKEKSMNGLPKEKKILTISCKKVEGSQLKLRLEIVRTYLLYHRWLIGYKEYVWSQLTNEDC